MIQLPTFVLDYLIQNAYLGKTRTLIIGENYPGLNYSKSYFYRSIPSCPDGSASSTPPAFFTNLCDTLMIPKNNLSGIKLTEFERLNKFLESGFLLMDAQEDKKEPLRPALLSQAEVDSLVSTILFINPANLIFLTNNNIHVISQLSKHNYFFLIQNKIVRNVLTGTQVFSFPSSPANPKLFAEQIQFARQFYFI